MSKVFIRCCLAVLVLSVAVPLLAQGTKVKVIVENASIRLKPSLDSEAIEESVPLNTVLTAEKKVGEWYEVKYESNVGVLLIGYIHEMYVEVLAAEAAPPVKEEERPPVREVRPPQPAPLPVMEAGLKSTEIFIGGGLGLWSLVPPSTTDYTHHFDPAGSLSYMDEVGQVNSPAGVPKGLSTSLGYFFNGKFGLRLRLDFDFPHALSGQSTYSLTWKFTTKGPFTETINWDSTGSLSVIPLSLNGVYRFNLGQFTPYVSAGPALFLGKLKIDTTVGLADTWTYLDAGILWRTIDYFAIPAYIDQALAQPGFNIGAGLDVVLSPNFGLTLDVAYFFMAKKEVAWRFTPGSYDANLDPSWYWDLTEEDLNNLLVHIPRVAVRGSFFKVLVGLKVFL